MADNTKDQKFRYEYTVIDHDGDPSTPKIPEVTTIGSKENPDYTRSMRIDALRHRFDQGARPNRYTANFFCPNLQLNLEGLRCTQASFPGRQLEMSDWSAYGPVEKHPYNLSMDGQEVSFTFVCDQSFADRFIIEAWQGAIFSGQSVSVDGDGESDGKEGFHSKETFGYGNSINPQFLYKNEYAGTVEITQMNTRGKPSLTYELLEAFPVAYAPQQMGYSETDQLMTFECTFAFRTFKTKYSNPSSSTALNRGRRAIDALLDLKNLRKGGNKANDSLQRFQDRLGRLDGLFS